jgi:hypothetical protein
MRRKTPDRIAQENWDAVDTLPELFEKLVRANRERPAP